MTIIFRESALPDGGTKVTWTTVGENSTKLWKNALSLIQEIPPKKRRWVESEKVWIIEPKGKKQYEHIKKSLKAESANLDPNKSNSDVIKEHQHTRDNATNLSPIETRYKGYRFRSRLEARWAVFFDALEIEWEYEPEGYKLKDEMYYLPDFYLPQYDAVVEIKGKEPTYEELDKLQHIAEHSDKLCAVFWGNIGEEHVLVFCSNVSDSGGGACWEEFYWHCWVSQPKFWFNGQVYEDGTTRKRYYTSNRFEELLPQFMQTFLMPNGKRVVMTKISTKDIFDAYKKARSARFEHGETP